MPGPVLRRLGSALLRGSSRIARPVRDNAVVVAAYSGRADASGVLSNAGPISMLCS
jgi:hypothetical protein